MTGTGVAKRTFLAVVLAVVCAGVACADGETGIPAGAVGFEGALLGYVKSVNDNSMVLAVRAIKSTDDSKAENAGQLRGRNVRLVFERYTTDDGESYPEPTLKPRADLALQTEGVAMVAVTSQEDILVVTRIAVSGGKRDRREKEGREGDRERIGDREREREGGDREKIGDREREREGDRERIGDGDPGFREGGDGEHVRHPEEGFNREGGDGDRWHEEGGDGFNGGDSEFDREEGERRIEAPEAGKMVIGVHAGGYALNGRRMSLEALENNLRHIAAESPDIAVSIQPDGTVPYSRVQKVLSACARNKLLRVSFAASPDKQANQEGERPEHPDQTGSVAELQNEIHQLRAELDELKAMLRKALEEK